VKCLLPYDAGSAMNTIWNREAPSIIVPHQTELSAPERPGRVPVRIITEQETKEEKKEKKRKEKKSLTHEGMRLMSTPS